MKKRHILVIAGASGVGKTTIATRLLSENAQLGFVRSVTTRAPRGDGHDSEYIYKSSEEFKSMADAGAFIEHMEYGGNMYGTPVFELERIFDDGKIPLLILDIKGVRSLRHRKFDFEPVIIYIWENLSVIEKRLYSRDLGEAPTAEKLISFVKRKDMNLRDYQNMTTIVDLFDAFVENDSIENAVVEIKSTFSKIVSGYRKDKEKNEKIAKELYKMTL